MEDNDEGNKNENIINIISQNNNNNIMSESQEKNEFQKMTEYLTKIREYRNNNYRKCLFKSSFCDFLLNGKWVVGYIVEMENQGIVVLDINKYYESNDSKKYQLDYSDRIAYYRKHTKPMSKNPILQRDNKNLLNERIKSLLSPDKINIFKDDKNENPTKIYEFYYYLHSTVYNSIDYAIVKSKEETSGIKEGFRIIILVLEILADFYNYINDNFEEFLNYKNNIVESELEDLVLFNQKYAIFSFWEDAQLLMNKIFLKNNNYSSWFIDYEKTLQKIVPSSPSMKKIASNDKLLCPLYEPQITSFKLQNYNYMTRTGTKIKLKKICIEESYKNKVIEINGNKFHSYILAYFIDYFHSLGGYNALFKLCTKYSNLKLATNIFENILYACSLTNNFRGLYEIEKNGINTTIFKFMDSITPETLKTYNKNELITFLKKGCSLYPNIKESSTFFFEELYIRLILKNIVLEKDLSKKLEFLDEIKNIIDSMDYNTILNEDKTIKNDNIKLAELNQKYQERDKLIKEMNYRSFSINCKNNEIIETLFQNNDIDKNILIKLVPILLVMYKNNFGYMMVEANEEKVKNTKKIVFDTILNKLKLSEKENFSLFIHLINIICDFCEVFTDDDKSFFFSEIKSIFYDSFFNQNISFKEMFNFLIRYSVIAVKKTNIYNDPLKEKENKDKKKDVKNLKNSKKNVISEEINIDTSNFTFDEKIYYGLEIIYAYLSFEQYNQLKMNEQQKIEFINIASDGIINIISNLKSSSFALNIILNKIFDSIKNKKDVLQHLLLLVKLLNYSNQDDFYTTFNKYFDEYLKKVELVIILIDELNSFLDNLKQYQIIDTNNEYDLNTNINNNIDIEIENQNENENAYLNENYNIKIRIKTIFNLLLKYNKEKLENNKIQGFFMKLMKYNEFTKNILCQYLIKYINKFSKDFLIYLYTNIISKKDIFRINTFEAYQICKNIIIQINKKENCLFLMNNRDIGLVINKKDMNNEIKGINILWDLLLNEEQNKDTNIIKDIIDFLCNIFFGVRIKLATNIVKAYEEYWTNLINNISEKLKNLIERKNKNIKGIKSLILLINKIINKLKNENGEIIKDLKEIIKESNNFNNKKPPKDYIFIGNKVGGEKLFMNDIKINGGDYFYILRYKLSNLYNMPVNHVGLKVYLNNNKNKKLNEVDMEKIYKNNVLKEYNYLNDFDNIYEQLNGLYEWNNCAKKKLTLLMEVKYIKNIGNDIIKTNPYDIIYKKSRLPIMLMSLLKESDMPYSLDVLNLVKGYNNNDYNSNYLNKEIEKSITENIKNNLFDYENTSIYYTSYIIFHLHNVIKNNLNNNFINAFIKCYIWNEKIKDLNIINNDGKPDKSQKIPKLGELCEKYNILNNLVNIYIYIIEYLGNNSIDEILFLIYKIINIYKSIINESIYIDLTKCSKSENESIEDVKNLYEKIINIINDSIINNEKIRNYIINSLINNDKNNEQLLNIKNSFEYIIFESILKNKYKSINKRKAYLLIQMINQVKSGKNDNKMFFSYLYEFYLTNNVFDKINIILINIDNTNTNINTIRYENNIKILFDIISEILSNIYEFIKEKYNANEYINNVILPKIHNIYIPKISKDSIFHQLILGGIIKIFFTILLIPNLNCYDLNYEKNKELIDYLFNNIIMSGCNEVSSDEDSPKEPIIVTSSFCIKNASNLFILLLFNDGNVSKDIYNNYIQKLTSLHKLCYWKGNNLSDWKLYYKENQKNTSFVGLKNLGCTCYINSLIQTLYHLPQFRECLLNFEYFPSNEKNCLYQLIKVFYSLKYLKASYYAPNSFINNYDNETLNANIQMDFFEFFCDFLDKIEQKLKGTNNENIIKYFFMGRQNDVLKFEGECNHHRVNESQFYSIQLQVQGKKDIYDSLDNLIEGERMDGDNCIYCGECDKKFPAIKSQNFKNLPRIFIFVLKRFEYDYQTFKKFKINDYYEFPLTLDMSKYTENYVENSGNKEDNTYKLKSIVIHEGTCEKGHYYSYILDDKNNEWYEFNDTKVQKFNIENLGIEAFGNKEKNEKNKKEKNRNAYILFYEKINKDNCEIFDKISLIEGLNGENKNINKEVNKIASENNIDNKYNENDFNLLDDNEINTNVINENKENKVDINKIKMNILNTINKETFNYFLNQRLFSGEYHHFILSLYLNMFNKLIAKEKILFNENLCSNNNSYIIPKEIKDFKKGRKTLELSNIENYISKKKIYTFDSNKKISNINNISISKEDEEVILDLFKNLIIYFFNVMIRAREKDYLGGTVNLIKYFINNYLFCADYIIEEFSNYNILIEYMINCPSYEMKKLVVGIIYCAMIKCVTTYEAKKRKENRASKNISQSTNNKTKETKDTSKKAGKSKTTEKNNNNNNSKKQSIENKEKVFQSETEQIMSDEELARKLQEEENMGYSGYNTGYTAKNYENSPVNKNNDYEENSNPLDRKYIPENVLKLIYNTLHIIIKIQFGNLNEARFLYLIVYRFSLISKKTKKFLINKAFVLEFLNILLSPKIKEERHDESKILNSMNKELFIPEHQILNTFKKQVDAIYDKGGAFHYENYIYLLYFFLLSYNQKPNSKHPYNEEAFNFDNKKFIKSLFFKINTKQDAYWFTYLICSKCNDIKTCKKRIDNIIFNIIKILDKADNNDKINYEKNVNRDNYYKGAYSENSSNNNIDYENDFPKINPKYILLMFKRFITKASGNPKIDEYRISSSLKATFNLLSKNAKYYNFTIMLIDFLSDLFINNINIMQAFITPFSKSLKELIQWLKIYPISPELYRIEGIFMFKSDNVAYKDNITEEERIKFNDDQTKKSDKRIQKLYNILEMKVKEYDYDFEADFDLTDFKFRKGDYIYYNKKKAVVKESLDELILIKIIDKERNISGNNYIRDEDSKSILDLEKVRFWVAKDDKNISIYNLE